MTEDEKEALNNLAKKKNFSGITLPSGNDGDLADPNAEPANQYFVPLIWATSLVSRARKENRIKDDFAAKTLTDVRIQQPVFVYIHRDPRRGFYTPSRIKMST